MIILPAIDILDAKAVRLYQGDYNTAHKVAADPLQTSIDFQSDGAEFIHLVDLSGARQANLWKLRQYCKSENTPRLK